jgi:uncharacterized membrane protein
MSEDDPDDPVPSLWSSLGAVEQAREWEEFRPGAFDKVYDLAEKNAVRKHALEEQKAIHEMRMDYLAIAIQIMALICGLTAVVIVALTARYYADHGAATAGARIFGFGTASIVAAFLGVNAAPVLRRVHSRWTRNK